MTEKKPRAKREVPPAEREMIDKLTKFQARQSQTYRELAETQVPHFVGAVVLELLAAGKPLSAPALLAAFQQRAESAPSRSGNGKPEFDLQLLLAEAAIARVMALAGAASVE